MTCNRKKSAELTAVFTEDDVSISKINNLVQLFTINLCQIGLHMYINLATVLANIQDTCTLLEFPRRKEFVVTIYPG